MCGLCTNCGFCRFSAFWTRKSVTISADSTYPIESRGSKFCPYVLNMAVDYPVICIQAIWKTFKKKLLSCHYSRWCVNKLIENLPLWDRQWNFKTIKINKMRFIYDCQHWWHEWIIIYLTVAFPTGTRLYKTINPELQLLQRTWLWHIIITTHLKSCHPIAFTVSLRKHDNRSWIFDFEISYESETIIFRKCKFWDETFRLMISGCEENFLRRNEFQYRKPLKSQI